MGATLPFEISGETQNVSIHAPVMGATWYPFPALATGLSFNPRARDGRDVPRAIAREVVRVVSIHAPVMGATGNPAD
tara:strand:- start:459 stop:689 length:231 start_codon:yes stop_codon:yes gene_type:complete